MQEKTESAYANHVDPVLIKSLQNIVREDTPKQLETLFEKVNSFPIMRQTMLNAIALGLCQTALIQEAEQAASSSTTVGKKISLLTALLAKNDPGINELLDKNGLLTLDAITDRKNSGHSAITYLLINNHHLTLTWLLRNLPSEKALSLLQEHGEDKSDEALLRYYENLVQDNICEKDYFAKIITQIANAVKNNNVIALQQVFEEINQLPHVIQQHLLFNECPDGKKYNSVPSCFRNAVVSNASSSVVECFYQQGFHLCLSTSSIKANALHYMLRSGKSSDAQLELMKLDSQFAINFDELSKQNQFDVVNFAASTTDHVFFQRYWNQTLSKYEDQELYSDVKHKVLPHVTKFTKSSLAVIYKQFRKKSEFKTVLVKSILYGDSAGKNESIFWLFENFSAEDIDSIFFRDNLEMDKAFSNKTTEAYLLMLEKMKGGFNTNLTAAYYPLLKQEQWPVIEEMISAKIHLPYQFWKNFNNELTLLLPHLEEFIRLSREVDIKDLLHKFCCKRSHSYRASSSIADSKYKTDMLTRVVNAVCLYHPNYITFLLKNELFHQALIPLEPEVKQLVAEKLEECENKGVAFTPAIANIIEQTSPDGLNDYLKYHLIDVPWEKQDGITQYLGPRVAEKLVKDELERRKTIEFYAMNFDFNQAINILRYLKGSDLFNQENNVEYQAVLFDVVKRCKTDDLVEVARLLPQIAPGIDFANTLFVKHIGFGKKENFDKLMQIIDENRWQLNFEELVQNDNRLTNFQCLSLVCFVAGANIVLDANKLNIMTETKEFIINNWLLPLIEGNVQENQALKEQIMEALNQVASMEGDITVDMLEKPFSEDLGQSYQSKETPHGRLFAASSSGPKARHIADEDSAEEEVDDATKHHNADCCIM